MTTLAAMIAAAALAVPTTVRVGMDPRTPPWVFVPGKDASREDVHAQPRLAPGDLARLAGLDVDVLHALEERMGTKLEIVPTAWLDLEKGLSAGRFDLILNAWTPSPAMPREIVASDPYYEWGLRVAVRASDTSIRSVPDLARRRIGHVSDPAVLPAVKAMGVGLSARLVLVDQGGGEMFARLARKELDAVIFDSTFVRWRVAQDDQFRLLGELLNSLGYHVGVRRSDVELYDRVQAAVKAFAASAEPMALRKKWEGPGAPKP